MEYTPVSADTFATLDGVEDWRYALSAIHASFRAGSFPAAAALVTAITEAAERAEHHPDMDIRYPGDVAVTLTTHATGGLSNHDVDLARTISALAATAGAHAAPLGVQQLEIAIDTMDAERIRPFWAAVLDYRDRFQTMTEPRPQRNRIHFDISVPHDVADDRLAAALAAGGTLVSDRRARAFWVLADADGNEICICTWQDRANQ